MSQNIGIGLSRGNKWINKAIRFFGKLESGSAYYDHAFLILPRGYIVEETFSGLRIAKLSKYSGRACKVFYPTFLKEKDAEIIETEAFKQVGTYQGIYGYTKFPLFILDSIFKTYWFTQKIGTKHFKVCSTFCAWLFYKAGYAPFKIWRSLSPDRLDDMLNNNGDWEMEIWEGVKNEQFNK